MDSWQPDYEAVLKQQFAKLFTSIVAGKSGKSIRTKAEAGFSVSKWLRAFQNAAEPKQWELIEQMVEQAIEDVNSRLDEIETEYDSIRRAGTNASSAKISKALYTFRDEMRELIAANEGATEAELAEKLRERFFGTIDYRVNRIARTTATVITGVSQQETWKRLNQSRPNNKRITRALLSMRDGKVRSKPDAAFDHKASDGNRENAEGLIDIGGELAPYPASDLLSAGNAVNCRCITFPIIG